VKNFAKQQQREGPNECAQKNLRLEPFFFRKKQRKERQRQKLGPQVGTEPPQNLGEVLKRPAPFALEEFRESIREVRAASKKASKGWRKSKPGKESEPDASGRAKNEEAWEQNGQRKSLVPKCFGANCP